MDTDVLIVGGGIVGCSLAYFLAREGTDVLVIDRFDLNTQASGTNAGSLHVQMMSFFAMEGDWERYARLEEKLPLYFAGSRMWRELERELGIEAEVKSGGGLMVAETDDQLRFLEKKVAGERRFGLTSGVVTGSELKNLAPYLSDAVIGADFCPDEGKVNPLIATPAIARAAEGAGAVFRRGTALLGLAREKQGFTATTSDGPIRCRRVANAAGPDMGAVAAMVGLAYASERLVLHMNATEPAAPFLPHLVQHANERLTLKQAANGNLLVGGGWPAVIDPATGQPGVVRTSVEGNLWVAQHLGARDGALAPDPHLGRRDGLQRRGKTDLRRGVRGAGLLQRPGLGRLHGRPVLRPRARRRDGGAQRRRRRGANRARAQRGLRRIRVSVLLRHARA